MQRDLVREDVNGTLEGRGGARRVIQRFAQLRQFEVGLVVPLVDRGERLQLGGRQLRRSPPAVDLRQEPVRARRPRVLGKQALRPLEIRYRRLRLALLRQRASQCELRIIVPLIPSPGVQLCARRALSVPDLAVRTHSG